MYGTGAYTFWACDDLFMEKQPDKPRSVFGDEESRGGECFPGLGRR